MISRTVDEDARDERIAFAATAAIVHHAFLSIGVSVEKVEAQHRVGLSRNGTSCYLPVSLGRAEEWPELSPGQAVLMGLRQTIKASVKGKIEMLSLVTGDREFVERLRKMPGFLSDR